MTNNGIKTAAILDALYQEKADEWRQSQDGGYVSLSYADFKKALMKHEVVVDPRTVRIKWELLTNIGIFAGSNKLKAAVDLVKFNERNPVAYDFSKEHRYTYIQKPETEEASQ